MRLALAFLALLILLPARMATGEVKAADSDGDGLSDQLEQHLLEQFVPRFEIAPHDCSVKPAEFTPNLTVPTVEAEDGTVYGQAFPVHPKTTTGSMPEVELHFFHLWRKDCAAHGHPLDAEHVAVLVRASTGDVNKADWKAVYWYAAAHEQTVCDVSQIARASTLHAESEGAQVWISPGKHASYLDARLCKAGCGADFCEQMVPLEIKRVVNLGEASHPMNGSEFVSAPGWQLAEKMQESNFPDEPVMRLERLPDTEIAWFHAGRHPVQGVIAVSSTTEDAVANSAARTGASLDTASDSTSDAISVAEGSTGSALGTSYRKTRHALGKSARAVGHAVGVKGKQVERSK